MELGKDSFSGKEVLGKIDQLIQKEFHQNQRIISFDEYLFFLADQPSLHTRGSAQYFVDVMDSFGVMPHDPKDKNPFRQEFPRFLIFDQPIDGICPKIIGQEKVQNQIYRALKSFSRQKMNHKLLLLHGPNGSAKTSIVHALMNGAELYSQSDEGALYSFNWIFPVERFTKHSLGIEKNLGSRPPLQSFAHLPEDEIASKIPCELKDHPLLLIPQEKRKLFLEGLLGEKEAEKVWNQLPTYLSEGNPCHRCKQIWDALLVANDGNFKKVLMHIQVERFYFSRRYRKGLVTIEPQMHVDAHYHQLTYNKSMGNLPTSLQSLNLFSLTGDLIDGNRGFIEFGDLLKRPIDSFKYLLGACETNSVNVSNAIAYLDTIFFGSTNELQLDAFKEFPDFTSFKARIELIRVPYLLNVSQEREIYSSHLKQVEHTQGGKAIAPHSDWIIALWAVLTRLKKPNSLSFSAQINPLISHLTPLQKAQLYDTGSLPDTLNPEERKILRSALPLIIDEYTNVAYYEGRMGASAREIKSILFDASQNTEFSSLSPLSILKELENFVKHLSEYEFLRQEIKDGYHDGNEFIRVVKEEYLNIIDQEVRTSIGLYDSKQWGEFLKKYILHMSTSLKKEKIKNPHTGQLEDPDFNLIEEFERIIEAPQESKQKEEFRQNMMSRLGAWSLDHLHETVDYSQVFPDYWKKIEKHYFETQKSLLNKMNDALLFYETENEDLSSEGSKLARQTLENMQSQLGYTKETAKEFVTFLLKSRY